MNTYLEYNRNGLRRITGLDVLKPAIAKGTLKLDSDCEFGDIKDDLIKDCVVYGIYDKKVKDRLLREAQLDLEKVRANENMSNNILSTIERKLMDVGRLIQNEEYDAAFQIILTLKRNLLRIRYIISYDTFETIDESLNKLKYICEENSVNNKERVAYAATKVYSGAPGRPKLNITKEQLELFLGENYTATQMAKHFGCSTKLIYTKCYSYGIKLRQRYFSGNEGVLNTAISDLHTAFPNSGSKVGTEALLKIKWKFAVHGCIDGYSRLVLYLKCTTSMTAETVVSFFANAVVEFGLPSRVRSDFGYENLFVAMIMNAIRGLSRGSHLTEQQDLYSRIINALGIEEVNENAISVPDINSHLTVQLDLTEEDEDAIKEVLSSPLNNKQKYTEIVELLNRN
ncbi:hypothetical protein FQR65_LT16423 [Abscondita terminalis]|nr:hypothetical protein FQR65_LT16423 [Abscondita terminalis]